MLPGNEKFLLKKSVTVLFNRYFLNEDILVGSLKLPYVTILNGQFGGKKKQKNISDCKLTVFGIVTVGSCPGMGANTGIPPVAIVTKSAYPA